MGAGAASLAKNAVVGACTPGARTSTIGGEGRREGGSHASPLPARAGTPPAGRVQPGRKSGALSEATAARLCRPPAEPSGFRRPAESPAATRRYSRAHDPKRRHLLRGRSRRDGGQRKVGGRRDGGQHGRRGISALCQGDRGPLRRGHATRCSRRTVLIGSCTPLMPSLASSWAWKWMPRATPPPCPPSLIPCSS